MRIYAHRLRNGQINHSLNDQQGMRHEHCSHLASEPSSQSSCLLAPRTTLICRALAKSHDRHRGWDSSGRRKSNLLDSPNFHLCLCDGCRTDHLCPVHETAFLETCSRPYPSCNTTLGTVSFSSKSGSSPAPRRRPSPSTAAARFLRAIAMLKRREQPPFMMTRCDQRGKPGFVKVSF